MARIYDPPIDITIVNSITGTVTTTTTGASMAVPSETWESAIVFLTCGTWVDGTHTLTITESVLGTTFTAAGTAARGALPAAITGTAGASQTYQVKYYGTGNYLKVLDTVVSGTTGMGLAAFAVLTGRKYSP